MSEKLLSQFKFSKELKEKMVTLVLYHGLDAKEVAKKYGLPNAYMLTNWINRHKQQLVKGAVFLPPMQKKKRRNAEDLRQEIKHLEKALEKANVLIYGLKSMIDYAEKELKIPIRKKPGTKQ